MTSQNHRHQGNLAGSLALVVTMLTGATMIHGSEADDQGNKYALVVGVNDYTESHAPFSSLAYPESDAIRLGETLRSHGYQVTMLTTSAGKDNPRLAPTAANVRKALEQLSEGKTEKDIILTAFSGHGVHYIVKDPLNKGPRRSFQFLCPEDADQNPKIEYETGITPRYLGVHEMVSLLNRSSSRHKLLFIDACRNENELQAREKSTDTTSGVIPGPGMRLLFSCKSGEKSYESKVVKAGLFFHYLIEGLKGAAADQNTGEISYDLLKHYVTVSLRDNAERLIGSGGVQVPYSMTGMDEKTTLTMARLEFIMIKKGIFNTGSPRTEIGRQHDENQLEIRINKDFHIGAREVTQGQFLAIMKYNPSKYATHAKGRPGINYPPGAVPGSGMLANKQISDTSDYPVENVSWEEAREYCRELTKTKAPIGYYYRLPTESEWEYACRGGIEAARNSNPFANKDFLVPVDGNFRHDDDMPTGLNVAPRKVGSYPALFRLHDMHGNVAEWCDDIYQPERQTNNQLAGFQQATKYRVIKGGSFASPLAHCRVAFRHRELQDRRNPLTGFRVVLVPLDSEEID